MAHVMLRCERCQESHPADMATIACSSCLGPLDVDYVDGRGAGSAPTEWAGFPISFPQHSPIAAWSLGEGNTPTVELPSMASRLGLERLYGKLELMNPSGSFKDRGAAVMMAVASEQAVAGVVEDSSGNAGASVSAYAARHSIRAHIFAPDSAPEAKLRQIRAYGADVHPIEGSRDDTTRAAVAFYRERGLVYASHAWSPYFVDGVKTFAYEVAAQLDGRAPDHLVFPVGNGGLLLGAWRGFMELRKAGRVSRVPRLHAVQATGVMPLVAEYRGDDLGQASAGSTLAGGIAVAAPARGHQVLAALRDTGGVAVAVDDPDIARMQGVLATSEGIFAEPTSAAAFAGLELLIRQGVIGNADVTLVPVTGSGLKDAVAV